MTKFTPLQYILIAIANHFGLDKVSWQERIEFSENMFARSTVRDCLLEAKEPLLMQKAINAYYDALSGKPTGYIMSLDATASGLQIMACLTGCKYTAQEVNLLNTGKRENIYQKVADKMELPLDVVKKPVMTHYYNSKRQPEEAFGTRVNEFLDIIEELLPGAEDAMVDIQSCFRNDVLANKWTLPDGHVAYVKNMVAVDKRIEVDELDHATFTHRVYENSTVKFDLSLPANIVHSIDGYICREMYRRAYAQGFELLSIHDSFWASPNYMQNVRENYRDILIDISKMNLLKSILREITEEKDLVYYKHSNNLHTYIQDAEYALS